MSAQITHCLKSEQPCVSAKISKFNSKEKARRVDVIRRKIRPNREECALRN